MSIVLVVAPSLEAADAALLPFWHGSADHQQFVDTEDSIRAAYESDPIECYTDQDGKPHHLYMVDETPEGWTQGNRPASDLYPTIEEYAEEYLGSSPRDKDKQRYGQWENPNGKFTSCEVIGVTPIEDNEIPRGVALVLRGEWFYECDFVLRDKMGPDDVVIAVEYV